MRISERAYSLLAVLFFTASVELAATGLPAFPGAEGFGAITPGGRGGRVIKVTNLNADGPGSFRAACGAEGPRIVVFDVSGVITGDVTIAHGKISVLGQTAPGAGITLRGMLVTPYGRKLPKVEDIVVRFMRFRPDSNLTLNQSGDALQLSNARRVILDHCSFAWASDETIDVFQADDVTVQWCTVEDGDTLGHEEGVHNYGLIQGPDGKRITVHHNLFAHMKRRCPAVANGPADIVNNVVYNFRDGFLHDNPTNGGIFNIVGNYYKRGPNDPQIFPFCFAKKTEYYLRDNFIYGLGLVQDPWAEKDRHPGLSYYARYGSRADKPAVCPPVTTQMPEEAYNLVLAKAGCFPRDFVTRRVVREVAEGSGSWGRRSQPDLLEGLTPGTAPMDTDSDGIPDEWEKARGLNPQDGSDCAKVMTGGYTAIEEYANERAVELLAEE